MTAVPPGPPLPGVRASVAVAFCPAPPLLHPAVEVRADDATSVLRDACALAVGDLLAMRPDVVVVVGRGLAPGLRLGVGDAGNLHGFGVWLEVPFQGRVRPGGRRAPLPHTLGAWLLDQAGFSGTRVGVAPADLGQLVRDLPGPVAVLAMGDGSARRSVKAPGYLDEGAGPFDAAVARALEAGDAAALASLDPDEGERLLASGVPVWRAVGDAVEGRPITPRLQLDAAPFGVGYLVASWVAG